MDYQISDLSPHLFWDVDRTKLEWGEGAYTIISGIVEYGLINDFKIMLEKYPRKKIIEVVTHLRALSPKTHHFLAIFFDLSVKDFRCYEQRLLNQGHWIY